MSGRVFVGLGSNVGDRLENLRRAVAALSSANGVAVVAVSSAYDTDPVGPAQANFLNAVVELATTLGPPDLLATLKSIENELGRTAGDRWGPREIDLDLLLYGDDVIAEDALHVPHPDMTTRAFVLVPLAEIAADVRIPGHATVFELLAGVGTAGVRLSGPL